MRVILPDDLILVAILKEPRDLEIARVLGWYRIPLVSAPKTVQVDWLAFYLPSTIGELKWSIRFIAPVKGYELLTRIELLREDVHHPRKTTPILSCSLVRSWSFKNRSPPNAGGASLFYTRRGNGCSWQRKSKTCECRHPTLAIGSGKFCVSGAI